MVQLRERDDACDPDTQQLLHTTPNDGVNFTATIVLVFNLRITTSTWEASRSRYAGRRRSKDRF